jgi:hypothetical protein
MKHALAGKCVDVRRSPESSGLCMQEERRQRTREAPKTPTRGDMMKSSALEHERVKSPLVHRLAAWARVELSNRERVGRRETA